MGESVAIPDDLLREIDLLVLQGIFRDRNEAVEDLLRRGLSTLRRIPPAPPEPSLPPSERPIGIRPEDVNWF